MSSPTSSGSAIGSRSWTTVAWWSRGPLAELLDRFALPVYRVEAEPGQATALEALAVRLRAADWVTGAAVEHGLLTVAVADPERAARGAPAGHHRGGRERDLSRPRETDIGGRVPAAHR